jgi:hypothetical protein
LNLTKEEEELVNVIGQRIKNENYEDYELVKQRFFLLNELGNAVGKYPSIRDMGFLKGICRSEDHLIESLLAFSNRSLLLRIPTKVVAMRSFLVAKFHAFSMLYYLTKNDADYNKSIKDINMSVISTLMAEEVYFTCLEDPDFSLNSKSQVADDLIALWDKGTDLRAVRHLTALSSLWIARDKAPPIFGTMAGNSELFRISMDMETDWHYFLKEESTSDETRWALDEFLFGLSYEELKQVRSRLVRHGISAVGYEEIRTFIGSKPAYSVVDSNDPRTIYDFFVERKDACSIRKKISAPGPLRTIEEVYLKYRIILELS